MTVKIRDIKARQIIDSRGIPTVETDVTLSTGAIGRASVPSGASTGKFEAKELRDEDKNIFFGKSVYNAIENIENKIKPILLEKNPFNQEEIDLLMIEKDGTKNKEKLGANAILSVSLAVAKACANEKNLPLYKYLGGIYAKEMPIPMMNIINGGKHANNKLDFQEFMICPIESCSIKESIKIGCEVYHELKRLIQNRRFSSAVGDEGGFAPDFKSNKEALDIIVEAIEKSSYSTDEVKICLDVAASELYKDGKYVLVGEGTELTCNEMVNYLEKLTKNYPIISIEDGLDEEDFEGWQLLTQRIGDKCQLVGDDLFVTNSKRLQEGIEKNIANSILIKPNQTGTLSETMNTILIAQKNNYKPIISHRSGETEDTFISDLAVATNAGQIKTGAPSRGERTAKYNQLIRIEEDCKSSIFKLK